MEGQMAVRWAIVAMATAAAVSVLWLSTGGSTGRVNPALERGTLAVGGTLPVGITAQHWVFQPGPLVEERLPSGGHVAPIQVGGPAAAEFTALRSWLWSDRIRVLAEFSAAPRCGEYPNPEAGIGTTVVRLLGVVLRALKRHTRVYTNATSPWMTNVLSDLLFKCIATDQLSHPLLNETSPSGSNPQTPEEGGWRARAVAQAFMHIPVGLIDPLREMATGALRATDLVYAQGPKDPCIRNAGFSTAFRTCVLAVEMPPPVIGVHIRGGDACSGEQAWRPACFTEGIDGAIRILQSHNITNGSIIQTTDDAATSARVRSMDAADTGFRIFMLDFDRKKHSVPSFSRAQLQKLRDAGEQADAADRRLGRKGGHGFGKQWRKATWLEYRTDVNQTELEMEYYLELGVLSQATHMIVGSFFSNTANLALLLSVAPNWLSFDTPYKFAAAGSRKQPTFLRNTTSKGPSV